MEILNQLLTPVSFQTCMTVILLRNTTEDILMNVLTVFIHKREVSEVQTTLDPIDSHFMDQKKQKSLGALSL